MNVVRSVAVFLIPVLCLTGCATIVGKDVFPLTINSNPDGVNISIVDDKGRKIYNGTTPSTISLAAGESYFHAKTYTITFSKEGYADQNATVKATMSGWYWGNFLFGGLIGLLIVDPISGKMWKLQPDVTANLTQKVAMEKGQQPVLNIMTFNQVPDNLKKYLISLN